MTSGFHVARAARCVRAGGVVAYPTEAVFGLGCLPADVEAVARILAAKQRTWRKGLLLIAADCAQAEVYAHLPDDPGMRERVLASWPGPATWLLEATEHAPPWITGGRPAIGIRVTAHPVARALCAAVGSAIVSTSANRGGQPPIRSPLTLRRTLGDAFDELLPGALGGLDAPTPIVDARDGRLVRAA